MKLALSFVTLALSLTSLVAATPEPGNVEANLIDIRPIVIPKLLEATISSSLLTLHAKQLEKFASLTSTTQPNRAFGSKGHNATVSYIKKLLDATGYYDTYLQTFPWPYSENSATFVVNGESVSTSAFTYGPGGTVEAPLVAVNNLGCERSDYPDAVAGSIALISRGTCEFGLKVAFAGAAGAAGAIIYNNVPGTLSGTLSQPTRPEGPYVPVGGISQEKGTELAASLSEGKDVVGKLDAIAFSETRYSSNLIATTKLGDKENIVFAGAHSDSVAAGPGINDDGSGTISILHIALHLPLFRVKNAVRFGWWTAEEFGLVGSEHHVTNLSEEERAKIALYLNFDMVASPNSGYFIMDGDGDTHGLVGPPGSEKIEKLYEEWYKAQGLTTAAAPFNGRSDYGPFLEVGIPAGGVLTGAEGIKTEEGAQWWGGEAGVAYDKCYHARCDTVDNLRTNVWVHNTKAAAHSIATYARSLDGIPRGNRTTTSRISVSRLDYEDRLHYACNHEVPAL